LAGGAVVWWEGESDGAGRALGGVSVTGGGVCVEVGRPQAGGQGAHLEALGGECLRVEEPRCVEGGEFSAPEGRVFGTDTLRTLASTSADGGSSPTERLVVAPGNPCTARNGDLGDRTALHHPIDVRSTASIAASSPRRPPT
jgi:hypothetical protein